MTCHSPGDGDGMAQIEVPVIVHELMTAATGNPITVRTISGDDVLLRLATADELLRFNRESRERVETLIGEPVSAPPLSRTRAEELCTPLVLP